ncbi:MAG: hypothetical protein AB7I27_05005 [Bacteriovoracaceae bacterium]
MSSFTLTALAGKDPLPQINPPKELVEVGGQFAEGTSTKLSDKDIALFIPWAQSAQTMLNDALKDIENMPLEEQVKHLQETIQSVVRSSGSKNYQMLMRFALNRTLLLLQELSKEADWHSSAIQANALDLSVAGIKTALKFYESDLAFQQRVAKGNGTFNPEYASFAKTFGASILTPIDSINDASAQMRLMYKTLEMVNWDLSRDEKAQDYSDTIVDIYNALNSMDEHPSKVDQENIKSIRKLIPLTQEVDNFKLVEVKIEPIVETQPAPVVSETIQNSIKDASPVTKNDTKDFDYYYAQVISINSPNKALEVAKAAANSKIDFNVYAATRWNPTYGAYNSHNESMEIAEAVQAKRADFGIYTATRFGLTSGAQNSHNESMEIAEAVQAKRADFGIYTATRFGLTSGAQNSHKESMVIAEAVQAKRADFDVYTATRFGLTSGAQNSHKESMVIAEAVQAKRADFDVYTATRFGLTSGAQNSHKESMEIAKAVQAKSADFRIYKLSRSGLGGSYSHNESMQAARIK